MQWIQEKDIDEFIEKNNYDVRVSKNARWIDQKCTPDVVTVIADCIINYVKEIGIDKEFTTSDIWHSIYTAENIEGLFQKPKINAAASKNEYDKFFQQPMELLAYSKVLEKSKRGNKNFYKINKQDLLFYISIRERNSLSFLQKYIKKVLVDSEIYPNFESFLENPSKETYLDVKEKFTEFTIKNTNINNKLECFRIFTKILNPIAYLNNTHGTARGTVSKQKITYDMLMYNRDNFRDIYSEKPKDMTRGEYKLKVKIKPNKEYFKYQSQKAKRALKAFNEKYRLGKSEVEEENSFASNGTNIHHIFSESEYPEISMYLENLIALTPNQHYLEAHPRNKTQIVSKSYQYICLINKLNRIEENYKEKEKIYELDRLKEVLAIGLNNDEFRELESKEEIVKELDKIYINGDD